MGLNSTPRFCPLCGGGLCESGVKPKSSWSANLECSSCGTKYLVSYGDEMGGAHFCELDTVELFPEEPKKVGN